MGASITIISNPVTQPAPVQILAAPSIPHVVLKPEHTLQWNFGTAYINTIVGATAFASTGINLPQGHYQINVTVLVQSSGNYDTFGLEIFENDVAITGRLGRLVTSGELISGMNTNNKRALSLMTLYTQPSGSGTRRLTCRVHSLSGENLNASFVHVPDTSGVFSVLRLGNV